MSEGGSQLEREAVTKGWMDTDREGGKERGREVCRREGGRDGSKEEGTQRGKKGATLDGKEQRRDRESEEWSEGWRKVGKEGEVFLQENVFGLRS